MKPTLTFLCWLSLLPFLHAQQFIQVKNGLLVNKPGDSRSVNLVDVNGDGLDDVFISKGLKGGQNNDLYLNLGKGNFQAITNDSVTLDMSPSDGATFADTDNDGFQDLVVSTCKNGQNDPEPSNMLFMNQGNKNTWVKIHLSGTKSNQAAIGAKLRVKSTINGKAVWQMRGISAQTGYAGQNSLTAHFGLANAKRVDELVIEWPSGAKQQFKKVKAGKRYQLKENGKLVIWPLCLCVFVSLCLCGELNPPQVALRLCICL